MREYHVRSRDLIGENLAKGSTGTIECLGRLKLLLGTKNHMTKPSNPLQPTNTLLADVNQFIDDESLRFLRTKNVYMAKSSIGEWYAIPAPAMKNAFGVMSIKDFPPALTICLEDRQLMYNALTYSYNDQPIDTLNMLDKSKWIPPMEGPHHHLFDVLMQSLGGGNPENIEHLEHTIASYYLRPEQSMMHPVIVMIGEGKIGKNLIVEKVFNVLFGGNAVVVDEVTGTFNSQLKGKSVVLLNELEGGRTIANRLKNIFGSNRIMINEKFLPAYWSDNTPLWMIGTNQVDGGVWLGRNASDRRYSIFEAKEGYSLSYWLARDAGENVEPFWDESNPRNVHWTTWMINAGQYIISDSDEVGKWINHLIQKHGMKGIPLALHGEDFRNLLDVQMPAHERIFEAVFTDPRFTHIAGEVLLRGYNIHAGSFSKTDRKFYKQVNMWLRRNNNPVIMETRWKIGNRTVRGWALASLKGSAKDDNIDAYLGKEGYRDVWTGPTVY